MLALLEPVSKVYITVGKVGSGFTDAQLEEVLSHS